MGRRVLRVDRQMDGQVLRVDRQVLRVDKRVLQVNKLVLRVGENYYKYPDK